MDEGTLVTPGSDGANETGNEHPAVTFKGNTYDLAALGALASALLLAFMCGTCNMGFYCMPLLPVVLGLVGLFSARQAVNYERTRLWSWIGIGVGGVILVLLVVALVAYFGLLFWMAWTGQQMR